MMLAASRKDWEGGTLFRGGPGDPPVLVQGLLLPHLCAVAMAAVHHLEHHLGLVAPVLLLVPLDALVDVSEGALAQALTLLGGENAGGRGPSPCPPVPPVP